jgi:hypothetical protein
VLACVTRKASRAIQIWADLTGRWRNVEAGVTPEAERILEVYRARGLRAGAMIHPAEFGDAIVWEAGFVRDEPVRRALAELFGESYLVEHNAALELTEKGSTHLYGLQPKHGARVYRLGSKLLIKQAVLRGTPAEYVIDEHKERHVCEDDDAAIAEAVRDATMGRL